MRKKTAGAAAPKSSGALVLSGIKGFFGAAGRIIATFAMVGIITGCIVACIMTVYVLKYIGAEDEIDLSAVKMGFTSFIYATDKDTGEAIELQRLYYGGQNRVWVDYENINKYTRDALVAVEDKRFWSHDGVDWRRTFGAFIGMFVPVQGTTTGGGSTITQQLIKNVTGDDDYRVERKVREMFRALNLSKRYTREDILEAYLNIAPFGNGTNGIQSAANLYFEKDAKDLTLAEAASIVGITQYPGYYDPFIKPENNKERQEYILSEMLDQGKITQAEHDKAVKEKLDWKGQQHFETLKMPQSYFVDQVINEVIADLIEEYGYTYNYASEQLYKGGYRVYATVDLDIQKHLEEIYSTTDNFPPVWNTVYPESASVILDPHTGGVLAMVGGIGEKEGSRVLNRATQSKRQPGSAIKPLATYALAFEYDRITWSTMIEDSPITVDNAGTQMSWPRNYYGRYDGMMPVVVAIQRSTNTIPAKLCEQLTARRIFDFLSNNLHFHSLVERVVIDGRVSTDITPSAMALGGMTYGVTPLEMAGGYQIYANGGLFIDPHTYTRVEDSQGRIVLEKDVTPRRVLSEDTSVVINRLLQKVVNSAPGTGTAANLGTMPTAGKTGTSTDDVDQWFIGLTPYYVCQVWLGYDEKLPENNYGTIGYSSYGPPILFRTIMAPLHENLEYRQFPDSENVVSHEYCTATGYLAAPGCTGRASGWYKKSHIPGYCPGHAAAPSDEEGGSGDNSTPNGSSSDNAPSIFDGLDIVRD